MANNDYKAANSGYLKANPGWHVEDSSWKATQILKMIGRNNLQPQSVVEIGCGAGEILNQLVQRMEDKTVEFSGYEISPDAFALCRQREKDRLHYYREDLMQNDTHHDLLLMIDVFEHVEDYLGFIRKASDKATYKLYHIPLDLSMLSLYYNYPAAARKNVGHLHYFMKDTALATLTDAGQEVIDWFYTPTLFEVNYKDLSFSGKLLNLLRRLHYRFRPDAAVRVFGGFSLMVLTK